MTTDPTNRAIDGGEERKLRYAPYRGSMDQNERARIQCGELFKIGDTILVWVNEGDLYSLGKQYDGALELPPPQSPPQAMGGEWKLVPVEPTEEMLAATKDDLSGAEAALILAKCHGFSLNWKDNKPPLYHAYKSMLAAAPSSPAPSSAKVIETGERPPEFWERGFDKLIAIQKSDAARIETLKEALFPPEEKREDGSFVDHSADENLDSAIIDLEMRGADKVCLSTLKKVLERLYRARAALADGGEG